MLSHHRKESYWQLVLESSLAPLSLLTAIILIVSFNSLLTDFWQSITYTYLILFGSYSLFSSSLKKLFSGSLALDYIAILAIMVGVFTGEYLVAAVIVLMYSSGSALETLASRLAKESLTKLSNRIPDTATSWQNGQPGIEVRIDRIKINDQIIISRGEVIPLDGILQSKSAVVDESTLTGEAYPVDKTEGDSIISGTINLGDSAIIKVTSTHHDSTYTQIIKLVEQAQASKPELVRLAHKYSGWFTLITLIIAGSTFYISKDIGLVLAVLVVATPCPLLIATPIALMGGMNSFAKKKIILKNLQAIESLSRVKALIFDKTGTITLGKPKVTKIEVLNDKYTNKQVIAIATALERHSYHPLAKAIVEYSINYKSPKITASNVHEEVGQGIEGIINGRLYRLIQDKSSSTMTVNLKQANSLVARFHFQDKIKVGSSHTMHRLIKEGLQLHLYTGDKQSTALEAVKALDVPITIHASCTPKDKMEGILKLKQQGLITAMVGDGINDAPALASSDVGIVFSHKEHTAASEAADVIILQSNFSHILDSLVISQKTVKIAIQSIIVGIGLSVLAMIVAAFGYLPALYGAILQEFIDIIVIINALRTSRLR